MIGRRVYAMDELTRPGDYYGPVRGYTGDRPAVFFLKPNAGDKGAPARARAVQHVTSPPHNFNENPDGSLSIHPSIADTTRGDSERDGWHGYLEPGHNWRQV